MRINAKRTAMQILFHCSTKNIKNWQEKENLRVYLLLPTRIKSRSVIAITKFLQPCVLKQKTRLTELSGYCKHVLTSLVLLSQMLILIRIARLYLLNYPVYRTGKG